MIRKPIIGVIGASDSAESTLHIAEELGGLIAQKDGVVICGGLGGVMEAVCRGAQQAGGLTIGVLPGAERTEANQYIDIPIVTGLSHARNVIIVRSAQVVIAVAGGYGTLSEIAFALKLKRPVIGINSWTIDAPIVTVSTAPEAIEKAWNFLTSQKQGP